MKSSHNIDSNDMMATVIGFFICVTIGLTFMYGLIWSLEKEHELGIHGKSSEALINGRNSRK